MGLEGILLVRAPTVSGRQEDMAGLELYQARADATARSLELYQAQAAASQDAITSRILRRALVHIVRAVGSSN